MKCLVLAGGSGDRLWPLSRKDFPKQFMDIGGGRSMFQDTILRNIPVCEEFIIITNSSYKNIVRGQLEVFQGLEYSIITEDSIRKTAPPVIAYLLTCDYNDEICITPSDGVVDGDYSGMIFEVKSHVKDGKFVALTCEPKKFSDGYNYVTNGKFTKFGVKPSKSAKWDTGIWLAKAGVFLNSFDQTIVEDCKKIKIIENVIDYSDLPELQPISLIKIVTNKECCLFPITFSWFRITDFSSYYNYSAKSVENNDNAISNANKGVEILNTVKEQLVVANGLKDTIIVNTRDAIYVSSRAKEIDIKGIVEKHHDLINGYFDVSPKKYESWGTEELIGDLEDCHVTMVKIYPNECVFEKLDGNTVLSIFVVEGCASVDCNGTSFEYSKLQSGTFSENKQYVISNVGKQLLVCVFTKQKISEKVETTVQPDRLVKMKSVFKNNLWGGTKIRDVLGKDVGQLDIIAESWELSAHKDGESQVGSGAYLGKTLTEYIECVGKEHLGWKAQNYERFPLMIKFIDAKDNLSIQVHPTDEYARTNEGDYGKNEMWHILDADDDAFIYVGFNKNVTIDEVNERIKNDTLIQILNKVRVKKGDTFFLKAGTVHAIGSGCLICEIQQSSNVTYRLYDYNRKDKNGNLRELHIEKALQVLDFNAYLPKSVDRYRGIIYSGYVKQLIAQCNYFSVNKYFIDGECTLPAMESSFQAIVALAGTGTISDGNKTHSTKMGNTWFALNNVSIKLSGKLTILVVNI